MNENFLYEKSDKNGNSEKIQANGDSAIILALVFGICIMAYVASKTHSKVFASTLLPAIILISIVAGVAVATNNKISSSNNQIGN